MHLTDIGANLSSTAFSHDREAVLERARAAGVTTIIVTGTSPEDNAAALELARAHPGFLYATAGLHPHLADRYNATVARTLADTLQAPEVVAAGEMGLDFHRDLSPRPAQERAFEEQLAIAAACAKPVFLHQREAHERFLPLLRSYRDSLVDGVVHCFTDQRTALYAYLDLGLFIGITGWICDRKRGAGLRELVSAIPAERLMIETDAPYLLPPEAKPQAQGRRNEPAFLPAVLASIARERPEPLEALAAITQENAHRFFRLPAVSQTTAS